MRELLRRAARRAAWVIVLSGVGLAVAWGPPPGGGGLPPDPRGETNKGLASAQAPAPVTDAEKQHITDLVRAILQKSTLPAWQGTVLPSFDLEIGQWPPAWKRGVLSFIDGPARIQYYGKRDTLSSFAVSAEWLRAGYKPEDLMSVDDAKTRLQSVLESIAPPGWNVDLHPGPFPSTRPDVVASFEWNPRYHGYIFEKGQGSEFEVDRLTGCIVYYYLNMAFFPTIHDEDCPVVSDDARASLGAAVQAMYAGYRPLRQAQTAGPAMTLISPAFDGRPNQMTDRLQLRFNNRELVLACRFQAYGYDDVGSLWLQDLYVDAVTGLPIGIYEEPRGNPTIGFNQSKPWTVSLDPARASWRVATAPRCREFALAAAKAPAPARSDGHCVLFSTDKNALCFEVALKGKVLWYGSGKDAKVWRAPKSAWPAIAASLKVRNPFPVRRKRTPTLSLRLDSNSRTAAGCLGRFSTLRSIRRGLRGSPAGATFTWCVSRWAPGSPGSGGFSD